MTRILTAGTNGIIGTLKSSGEHDSGCARIDRHATKIVKAEMAQIVHAMALKPCCSSVTPTAENTIHATAKIQIYFCHIIERSKVIRLCLCTNFVQIIGQNLLKMAEFIPTTLVEIAFGLFDLGL